MRIQTQYMNRIKCINNCSGLYHISYMAIWQVIQYCWRVCHTKVFVIVGLFDRII